MQGPERGGERLNRGFLIDGEHGRLVVRIHVQPDYVRRRGLEAGFLPLHVSLDYQVHFTPTSASWLNQVRVFAQITTRRMRRGTFENVRALEVAIDRYLMHHHAPCEPFHWTATADAIVDMVTRFCDRTSETRH